MNEISYLSPAPPRILAHRGFAQTYSENTLEAFRGAIFGGADYIESDLQVTRDGVAVLFHDDDLTRVAGLPRKISEMSLEELSDLPLIDGGTIPTLEQALKVFPNARFNLDFKVSKVIAPAAGVINRLGAHRRILVASFSDRRRGMALRQLNGKVASSAGSSRVLAIYLAYRLGLRVLVRMLAKPVQALQIPVSAGMIRFDNAKFIAAMHSAGLEVHFWTINNVSEMARLIALGAHGIVTDRTDLAVKTLRIK